MKKITIFLYAAAAAALAMGLAACSSAGSNTATPSPAPTATASPAPETPETPAIDETAPSGDAGSTPAAEGDAALTATLEKIYAEKDPGLMLATTPVDFNDASWVRYYTGLESDAAAKLDAAVASEAAIGSQAYSVVLARVKDPADAAATAQAMLDGIDPRKWVCVMADDVRVVAKGDTVMLAMVESSLSDAVTAQELVDAFTTVVGTPDVDLTRTDVVD